MEQIIKNFVRSDKIDLSTQERNALCAMAQKGDIKARNRVILCMTPWIKSVTRMRINGFLHEDLYDMALDSVFEAISDFDCRLPDGNFLYWCKSKLFSKISHNSNQVQVEELDEKLEEELPDGEQDMLELRISSEEMDMLRKVICLLSPERQKLLNLRFGLDGRPPKNGNQLTEEMGCSTRRIYTKLKDAIRDVRRHKRLLMEIRDGKY